VSAKQGSNLDELLKTVQAYLPENAPLFDEDDITEGTDGCYSGTGTNAAYSDTGKYYESTDTIDVAVSAGLTDGTAYIVVRYWDLSTCDLAAST
jgi:hypothetical protein